MKDRINSLQVVRALAFIGVLVSHSHLTVFSASGACGVSIFFVLSGFLMSYSYGNSEWLQECNIKKCFEFGIKKVKKIYPLYIVSLIFAFPFLLFKVLRDRAIAISVIKILSNVFLLQAWIPKEEIYFSMNPVAWYLSAIFFLYMIFPVINYFVRRIKRIKAYYIIIFCILIIEVILCYVAYGIQKYGVVSEGFFHWFIYIFPISRLQDFFAGCILGYIFIYAKHKTKYSNAIFTAIELAVLGIIVLEQILYVVCIAIPESNGLIKPYDGWWGLTIPWTLPSCFLVYSFATGRGYLSKLLSKSKVIVTIGDMSATGFLIHKIIYMYLVAIEKVVFKTEYRLLNIFICIIVTILFAILWKKITESFRKNRLEKR